MWAVLRDRSHSRSDAAQGRNGAGPPKHGCNTAALACPSWESRLPGLAESRARGFSRPSSNCCAGSSDGLGCQLPSQYRQYVAGRAGIEGRPRPIGPLNLSQNPVKLGLRDQSSANGATVGGRSDHPIAAFTSAGIVAEAGNGGVLYLAIAKVRGKVMMNKRFGIHLLFWLIASLAAMPMAFARRTHRQVVAAA